MYGETSLVRRADDRQVRLPTGEVLRIRAAERARGDRLERLVFKGDMVNLDPRFATDRFRDDLAALGCDRPVLPGIMPISNIAQVTRMAHMSGAEVPSGLFFQLATWHTINFAYTRQVQAELQAVRREAGERHKLDRLLALIDQRAGHWLAIQVEAAKIALSSTEQHTMDLAQLEASLSCLVAREEFDQAIDTLLARIETTLSRLLADAQLRAAQVDTVFFTGGASGVPLLRQRVAAMFPAARVVEGDRDGSIGRGLARDMRVRWALEEAGLPYRVESTPFKDRGPEHYANQPFAQVPWLTDGDLSIFESGAILLHLGEMSDKLMISVANELMFTLANVVAHFQHKSFNFHSFQ